MRRAFRVRSLKSFCLHKHRTKVCCTLNPVNNNNLPFLGLAQHRSLISPSVDPISLGQLYSLRCEIGHQIATNWISYFHKWASNRSKHFDNVRYFTVHWHRTRMHCRALINSRYSNLLITEAAKYSPYMENLIKNNFANSQVENMRKYLLFMRNFEMRFFLVTKCVRRSYHQCVWLSLASQANLKCMKEPFNLART